MRAVSMLIAMALLFATVFAAGGAATLPKAEMPKLATLSRLVHKVSGEFSKNKFLQHHEILNEKARGRKFGAQQSTSASCNQDQFSQAQVTVLQACPSLSGLISGTVTAAEFLPTFCGSNCESVMQQQLTLNAACLDGSVAFLLGWIDTCNKRPQCFSAGFLQGSETLGSQCNSIGTLLNFDNATDAAKADVTAACTNGCVDKVASFYTTYGVCIQAEAPKMNINALVGLVKGMCTKYNGEYCAWNLRNIGYLNCDSNCATSKLCNSQCKLAPTNAQLESVCSPCLGTLLENLAGLGTDPVQLSAMATLVCARVDPNNSTSAFCYPLVNAAESSSESSAPTDAMVAAVCASDVGKCYPRFLLAAGTMQQAMAKQSFEYCLEYYSSYYADSCANSFVDSLRQADLMKQQANLICATNAAGGSCYVALYNFSTSRCFTGSLSWGQCYDTTTCPDELKTLVTSAGCCTPMINNYVRDMMSSFPQSLVPSGTQTYNSSSGGSSVTYTFDPMYTKGQLDRSQQPMNAVAYCYNTSDLWAAVEGACPLSANAVNLSLSVYLSWPQVNADPVKKQQFKDALRADSANAMAISPSAIKKDDLVEDSSIQVQQASGSSRRATTSTSGCKYVFVVDAGADTAAAAATFNNAVKSNTLDTPSVAATASTVCQTCLDARASSGVNVNMPPSGSGGSSSSAASAAVVLSALFAAFVALLL